MAIDETLDVMLRQLREDAKLGDNDFRAAVISGLLSRFPVAGAVIDNLLREKAARNVNRRIKQLFEEMGHRLEEIKDSIPDEDYFGSEEFQTLLMLAIEQLQTTHDQAKRKMLAAALANSGSEDFHIDADKEQYVRTLRDLSPGDLDVLARLAPQFVPYDHLPQIRKNAAGSELCSLSRLAALGLVAETLTAKPAPPGGGSDGFIKWVTQLPDRQHQISGYGQRFLKFLSDDSNQSKSG